MKIQIQLGNCFLSVALFEQLTRFWNMDIVSEDVKQ